jgi:hypothetical protein
MPSPPENVRKSLTEIIEYLWADELKHMRSVAASDPKSSRGEHVFAYLMSIRAWLEPEYLPAEIRSQARKLANYLLGETGPCLPETIRTAALQVYSWPGDTLAIQRIVDFLAHEFDKTEYCRPPEQIWEAFKEVQKWFETAMHG